MHNEDVNKTWLSQVIMQKKAQSIQAKCQRETLEISGLMIASKTCLPIRCTGSGSHSAWVVPKVPISNFFAILATNGAAR